MAALAKMGAYLRTLKTFRVEADVTHENVLDDGEKTQFETRVNLLARMPNRLWAKRSDDRIERSFYYDGNEFTLFAERMGLYATVPAPPTIRELAQRLEEKHDLELPLVDLFRWGTPDASSAAIERAVFLGPAVVKGATCEHYAFRQNDIDWQLWIQQGENPLPRKLVITTTTDASRPQSMALYTWDLAPSFNESTFRFVPPEGARRVVLQAGTESGARSEP